MIVDTKANVKVIFSSKITGFLAFNLALSKAIPGYTLIGGGFNRDIIKNGLTLDYMKSYDKCYSSFFRNKDLQKALVKQYGHFMENSQTLKENCDFSKDIVAAGLNPQEKLRYITCNEHGQLVLQDSFNFNSNLIEVPFSYDHSPDNSFVFAVLYMITEKVKPDIVQPLNIDFNY